MAVCSVEAAVDLVVVIRLYPSKQQDLLAARLACSPLAVAVLLAHLELPQLLDLLGPTETATEVVEVAEVAVLPWRRLPPVPPVALVGVVAEVVAAEDAA